MSNFWTDLILHAAIIVSAVAQTMFIFLYGTSPWWRHYIGQAMFIKSVSMTLLLDAEVIALLYPEYPHRAEVTAVVHVLIAAAVIWQLFAFLKQKLNIGVHRDL